MSLVSGKQYSTEITSRKNFIINGNFEVWQRGTSFSSNADSYGGFGPDRIYYEQSSAVRLTYAQSTDIPTYAQSGIYSNYSMHFDVTTATGTLGASDYALFLYSVEGHDYLQLGGGNATLSFWVKADKTGTYSIRLRNNGSDRFYYTEYTIDVADTWEKKSITVPLTETGGTWNYTNGLGLQILWNLALGTDRQTGTINSWTTTSAVGTANQVNSLDSTANNFRIAQIQLEAGTVATEFERRHIGEEALLCYRYFWDSATAFTLKSYNTNSMDCIIQFPVPMRSTNYVVTASRINFTVGTQQKKITEYREIIASSLSASSRYFNGITFDAEL